MSTMKELKTPSPSAVEFVGQRHGKLLAPQSEASMQDSLQASCSIVSCVPPSQVSVAGRSSTDSSICSEHVAALDPPSPASVRCRLSVPTSSHSVSTLDCPSIEPSLQIRCAGQSQRRLSDSSNSINVESSHSNFFVGSKRVDESHVTMKKCRSRKISDCDLWASNACESKSSSVPSLNLPSSDQAAKRSTNDLTKVRRMSLVGSSTKSNHDPLHGRSMKRRRLDKPKEETRTNLRSETMSKSPICSPSTAPYYEDVARKMGMISSQSALFHAREKTQKDGSGGNTLVIEDENDNEKSVPNQKLHPARSTGPIRAALLPKNVSSTTEWPVFLSHLPMGYALTHNLNLLRIRDILGMNQDESKEDTKGRECIECVPASPLSNEDGSLVLSRAKDPEHLNEIHCFVRRHLEFFAATSEDITAPAPGRKSKIMLGQVGIRCIHCSNSPSKDRVLRSVCYPSSLGGIYHTVSNMKFDHFSKCKSLPEEHRREFLALREVCQRRGKDTKSNTGLDPPKVMKKPGNANSTAQYYHDSAIRLGLVDSGTGIRFKSQLSSQQIKTEISEYHQMASASQYSDVPDGISALMIAADVHSMRKMLKLKI